MHSYHCEDFWYWKKNNFLFTTHTTFYFPFYEIFEIIFIKLLFKIRNGYKLQSHYYLRNKILSLKTGQVMKFSVLSYCGISLIISTNSLDSGLKNWKLSSRDLAQWMHPECRSEPISMITLRPWYLLTSYCGYFNNMVFRDRIEWHFILWHKIIYRYSYFSC